VGHAAGGQPECALLVVALDEPGIFVECCFYLSFQPSDRRSDGRDSCVHRGSATHAGCFWFAGRESFQRSRSCQEQD
jgi:hypothetical protein